MTTDAVDHEVDFDLERIRVLEEENRVLKQEIRVARESAEITASLVVKQFEETEKILRRFQEANAQRKAVLDSAAQMAIIATNKSGQIIVFNKGAENLLGYKSEEIIGKKTPLIFHDPSELAERSRILSKACGRTLTDVDILLEYAIRHSSWQQEWIYVRKNRGKFPVSMSINALIDPSGDVAGFLLLASDITEKKRSDRALKESERNYRLLINNLPNIVFKAYDDGAVEFFDDKIEHLTGYPRWMFIDKQITWFDIIHEDDREFARQKYIEALKGDKTYSAEYRIIKNTGENIWVEVGGQIICNEEGGMDFITGAFLDITERKLADQALYESEEKYRSLFNSGPNPIFVLGMDTPHEIIDANPSAVETYGYNRSELLGQPFSTLGAFESEESDGIFFSPGELANGCVVSQKVRHRRKGGHPFYLKVNACPVSYQDRQAIILAATDITETIEKDAQLYQASKMTTLGEMSAGIAHELNQPLNAIKLGSEYFKMMTREKREIPEKNLLKVVDSISEQVDRASDIIQRLRVFGRRADFKKEQVSVNTAISRVISIIGQQLMLQNIRVELDLPEDLPPIMANSNRLEQVVFNLVTNARDAIDQKTTPADGFEERVIKFQSFLENDQVIFTISDTGMGIPKNDLEKIFEPFFTTKEVGKGMGLGLSIIYGIVNDYNGRFEVDTSEGDGTTFTFFFPRAAS
ncbi:MAG: PAS domain S-box protein [Desulfobacteraceae bacterium]|nr:PAS domain S-box protein [Desulfobacteraceae bacterium]